MRNGIIDPQDKGQRCPLAERLTFRAKYMWQALLILMKNGFGY